MEEYLGTRGITQEDLIVGCQVGTSTPSRRWLPERFVTLGTRLLQEYPSMWIVLTGSSEERDLCERVAEQIVP